MAATTAPATTHHVTTDGQDYFVQDANGGFLRDERGIILSYRVRDDAHEVAAARNEGRPIRSREEAARLVRLAASPYPYPQVDSYARVRYQGSLTEYHGAVLRAEECLCAGDCGNWELEGQVGNRWITIRHSRTGSFVVLGD